MKKDEICKAIVDTILSDNILNREELTARIKPIIGIWIRESRVVSVPKDRIKAHEKLNKMNKAIEYSKAESMFLRDELKRTKTESEIQKLYTDLDNHLVIHGFKTK